MSEWDRVGGCVQVSGDPPLPPMPQTLLAIAAIAAAGLLTLSQGQAVHSTTESVMRDQFELTVAGTLLHTLEFADARAFDQATTPAALRARYGLPDSMTAEELSNVTFDDFANLPVSAFETTAHFGGEACNVEDPWKTPACDDADDLDGGEWQEVRFETPDGHPLPVEVRASVVYVEANAPDVPVPGPTYHKRVEVFARTTAFKSRSEPVEIALRRVISYDPVVAAEYLRRSIRVVDGPACEGEAAWLSEKGRLEGALGQARASQATTSAPVGRLGDALAASERALTDAQGVLDDAVGARNEAQRRVLAAQAARTEAEAAGAAAAASRTAAGRALATAQSAAAAAQTRAATAQGGAVTARQAAERARAARDAAYDAAVGSYYSGTVVYNGVRYWRSAAARDAFNALADRYYQDRDAAAAAETAAVDAEAAAGVATADAQRAADAADRARDAFDVADAAASVAQAAAAAAAARAQADYDAGIAARTAAAAQVTAATSALDQARSAVARDRAALAEAEAAADAVDQRVADAEAALAAHAAGRPDCA